MTLMVCALVGTRIGPRTNSWF